MEGFGYPAFLTSTGGDLIDAQYDGRLKLGLDGRRPWGRLRPSTFTKRCVFRSSSRRRATFDAEDQDWLRQAYEDNS